MTGYVVDVNRPSLARKKELVKGYRERIKKANLVIFIDFSGIDAWPMSQLRMGIKEKGGEMVVGRNTLFFRAFMDTPVADHEDEVFTGPTAAIFSYGDMVELTKFVVDEIIKKYETTKIKGGYLVEQNQFLSPQEVEAISKLPSREQALAMLIGAIRGPVQKLYSLLRAVPQNLLLTLKAYEEKKKEGGES
ncbi:MAG: 50S ribosomal protein L10 [Aquificaceae bacterium]|nr:MAG: 50S ribosomal protein L10 [Aquificaceae bacterium]